MPGIPLATGKQQDCLLYLVTIATGLECEAIVVALCWQSKARCVDGSPLCLPGHASEGLCHALVAFHSWRKFSGALVE